jgi:hypothetical protein
MNFLIFWPFTFIISKKFRLHLFELIKDEATLKVRYMDHESLDIPTTLMHPLCLCPSKHVSRLRTNYFLFASA